MRPRSLPVVAVLLALALAACGGDTVPASPAAAPAPVTATPQVTEPPASPSPSATPTPSATPAAPTTPPAPPATPAKPAYDVAQVQRTLTDLKYYVGAIDGKAGPAFQSSVMAFQKVQGLSADGVVGKNTLAALAAPKAPQLKASSPANRVEVDLTKQVLYVVKGGELRRILPVSSGSGETYTQKNGRTARSLTPTGWYKIERRIVGVRNADLGTLYDPQYFYRGWAIHGSNSVPAYPASHGCVRVTRADAKWLLDQINVGWSVYLYGGKHTFSAGSSAPGTDDPTGDTPAAAPAKQPQAPSPEPTVPAPSSPAAEPTTPAPADPTATPTA